MALIKILVLMGHQKALSESVLPQEDLECRLRYSMRHRTR
jgi:hypothetical protein